MRIETDRLILRDLKDSDLSDLVGQANSLSVSKTLALVPHPYTEKDGKWFIDHSKEESEKKPRENYELGIELKEGGKFIGVVSLTHIDAFQKKSYFGLLAWGESLGEGNYE